MTADSITLRSTRSERGSPARMTRTPDPAFDAIPRLIRLRDALAAEPRSDTPSRWHEPPVFFFDPRRQVELTSVRPRPESRRVADAVAAELPALFASVDVRRAARAIPGLRDAAIQHGATVLADLLAIPDDETILVLHPELRVGFRVLVRGVVDVAQFHLLMLDAAGDLLPGPALSWRFRTACAEINPVIPAGVPMTAEFRYQFFRPSALQSDGSLPPGFRGCDHWLWGTQPLSVVPRIDGERMVLLGTPAFRQTWEVERRFPALAAEVKLLEALSPFRTLEKLNRLVGRPLPLQPSVADVPVLARAA